MALIECPNCKRKISDTQPACIHCGYLLLKENFSVEAEGEEEKESEKKQFDDIERSEQTALWDEFYHIHPKYRKVKNKMLQQEKLQKWRVVDLIMFILLLIGGRFLIDEEKIVSVQLFYGGVALYVLFCLRMVVTAIILKILLNKNKKRWLIVLKRFQQWLSEKKQIEYTVKFETIKQKRYFECIDLKSEYY